MTTFIATAAHRGTQRLVHSYACRPISICDYGCALSACSVENHRASRSRPKSPATSSVRWLATTTSSASTNAARRRRPRFEAFKLSDKTTSNAFGRLDEPYQLGRGGDNLEDYYKKASLSPWVPLSDAAARKIFDLAQVSSTDCHVDLGSGDGRVCFHAIDFGVQQSTGIDVDEGIVRVARDRLAKRHPPPPLQFVVADLLDPDNDEAWKIVQDASLITMYFAKEALQVFRPLLEQKLVGRQCKIITCGYEMPNWTWTQFEVVLGTQLYLYEWGSSVVDDEYGDLPFIDSVLLNRPRELEKEAMDSERFQGANVIDRTNVIRGYNPNVLQEMNDDDDDDWDDDADGPSETTADETTPSVDDGQRGSSRT